MIAIADELLDALLETANVGTGRAAASLSELTGRRVEITVPELTIFNAGDEVALADLQNVAILRVAQNFWKEPEGHALLLLNQPGAIRVAKLILGEEMEVESFAETEQSALLELGNIMINGLIGSIANQLGLKLNYGVPSLDVKGVAIFGDLLLDFLPKSGGKIVFMRAALKISEETIEGYLLLVLDERNLQLVLTKLEATL